MNTKFWSENPKEREGLGDLIRRLQKILKWILKEQREDVDWI
jgi:hypothetical protein